MYFLVSIAAAALFWATQIAASYSTVESRYKDGNSIRYKEFKDGELCHGGQKSYAGWADIGERHLFYWYHPTRSNKPAPLMIWLQGGPGGSSMVGMLALHGPCLVSTAHDSAVFNPHSWTSVYNVIYVDQPAGVGFSYVDDHTNASSYPRRTEESALDFIAFLRLLPDIFPELEGIPIHIAGESYGGRYVPEYASAILEYNSHVSAAARIPLRSLLIGNGLTNLGLQYPALYDTGCFTHDGIAPIFNTTECEAMAVAAARCEILQQQCDMNPDEIICLASGKFCDDNLFMGIEHKYVDRYNRNMTCPPGDCYPRVDRVVDFMNSALVRNALEIDSAIPFAFKSWLLESKLIEKRYHESADYYTSSVPALVRVLEHENPRVEVLYYNGINDWVCGAIGNRRMLENIPWRNWAKFRAQPMKELPWKLSNGDAAGRTKAVNGLDYVELNRGGHLYALDQPENALQLVTAWLDKINRLDGQRNYGKIQQILH